MPPGVNLRRGAATEAPDASPHPSSAAPGARSDWVWIAGEKTSVTHHRNGGADSPHRCGPATSDPHHSHSPEIRSGRFLIWRRRTASTVRAIAAFSAAVALDRAG